MLMGMLSALRAVLFGTLLLFMTLTVFSTLAVNTVRPVAHRLDELGALGDCDHCGSAFDDVMTANLTFFSTILAGDSWGRLALPLCKADLSCCIILIAAVLTINLGLLNTIAAVIVDRQVQAREQDVDFLAALQAEDLTQSVDNLTRTYAGCAGDDGVMQY